VEVLLNWGANFNDIAQVMFLIPAAPFEAFRNSCSSNKLLGISSLIGFTQAGRTPLIFAAARGHLEVCEFLLLRGAPVDTKCHVSLAIYYVGVISAMSFWRLTPSVRFACSTLFIGFPT
jgi:hypothetical protein